MHERLCEACIFVHSVRHRSIHRRVTGVRDKASTPCDTQLRYDRVTISSHFQPAMLHVQTRTRLTVTMQIACYMQSRA